MMTAPSDPPAQPTAPPLAYAQALPPLAAPAPVIAYASGDTTGVAPTGTRVGLGILATVYLLIAIPAVPGIVFSAFENVSEGEGIFVILLHLAGAAIAGANVACGVWLIRRRRWMWRALHVTLACLCVLELIVAGLGAALIVAYKHATGWDSLALGIGIILFVAASVPFLLHALTKLALLRLNVRRAFAMADRAPHTLHRVGTISMLSLYVLLIVVGGTWYILR